MYKQIVVGYDGSDRALRAVEEAADLSTAVGSVLNIVTAVDKADEIHEFGESSDKMYLSNKQIAQEQLANVASKFGHLDVRTSAVAGAPARVLLEEASRIDADLILVGNRHVQGISRVLGSVAEDVAHKAPCAVLIAKTA
ncbi:MAG: universal stress protein [Acidimicrobiia bacterium]|nr:universal stress protein [Acidimicrobiia bacterium]